MKRPWVYMSSPSRSPLPPPSPPAPSRSSQSTRSERLSPASNQGWWSVSPLIVYMFRCCSLETSHPRLLPQSLNDCSINLCLFFWWFWCMCMCSIHFPIFLNGLFIYYNFFHHSQKLKPQIICRSYLYCRSETREKVHSYLKTAKRKERYMVAISNQTSYPLLTVIIFDAVTLCHTSYLINELTLSNSWVFLI